MELPTRSADQFPPGSLRDVKAHYARFGERLGYTQRPPEEIVNELGYKLLRMKELDRSLEEAGKKDEALASCRKAYFTR